MKATSHGAWAIGLCLLVAGSAVASGQRGTKLTKELIEGFSPLTAKEALERRPNYVGSTDKWHVFMRVQTSVGGGMPFDHLSTYKVPVASLKVVNGWTIVFSENVIEANSCPVPTGSDGKLEVPKNPEVRKRCGT